MDAAEKIWSKIGEGKIKALNRPTTNSLQIICLLRCQLDDELGAVAVKPREEKFRSSWREEFAA